MKAFLDSLGCDEVDVKIDNEVSITSMAEKAKARQSLLVARLRTGVYFYENEELGAEERMHQTVQG